MTGMKQNAHPIVLMSEAEFNEFMTGGLDRLLADIEAAEEAEEDAERFDFGWEA